VRVASSGAGQTSPVGNCGAGAMSPAREKKFVSPGVIQTSPDGGGSGRQCNDANQSKHNFLERPHHRSLQVAIGRLQLETCVRLLPTL